MKIDSKNKKKLQIMIFVLIGVITLGVGYAAMSTIYLNINGDASATTGTVTYDVKFLSESGVTPTFNSNSNEVSGTVTVTSDTTATFSATGFSDVGQTAVATYKIKNASRGVGTRISLDLDYTNHEYFKVTETIADTELQVGDETEATVTLEVIDLPLESNVDFSTEVTAKLIAEPIGNREATGNDSATLPIQYKYSISYNNIGSQLYGEISSFDEAKQTFGHPAVEAHIIKNGVIAESYVAYERNGTIYYIRGGVNEVSSPDKPVYNQNVETLKAAFGPNWSDYCYESDHGEASFRCSEYDDYYGSYLYAITSEEGQTGVYSGGGWQCYSNSSGHSYAYN